MVRGRLRREERRILVRASTVESIPGGGGQMLK